MPQESRHKAPETPTQFSAPLPVVVFLLLFLISLLAVPPALLLLKLMNLPLWLGVGIPFLVLAAYFILVNTQLGLCAIAIAIAPLTNFGREVAGVTISLPELLILLLFAKEALIFFGRQDKIAPLLPWRSLVLYLAAATLAFLNGLRYGNGFMPALQDLRQFSEFILLYLLIVHRVADGKQVRQILTCYLAGVTLLAVHGVIQATTGWGLPGMQLLSDQIYIGGIRGGSLYGATPQGGLMVLGLGAALSLIFSAPSRIYGAIACACLALCVIGAVYTQTRASWIAMAFSFFLIFLAMRKSPGVISLAIIGLLLFVIVLGPMVFQRLGSISFSKAEQSLYERLQYYTVAWHIFRSHPFGGLGWGCYYDVQSILVNQAYVAVPNFSEHFDASQSTVHSAYLQLLVKTGLIGLVTFLIFIATWVINAFQVWRGKGERSPEAWAFIGLAAGLFGYLLHCAGENFFQWPVMSMSFYLLLGCSTVLAHHALNPDQARNSTANKADQ